MKKRLIGIACAIGMAALATTAVADPAGISVERSWARASTPASKTAAAYMTVINNSGVAVRLVGASTPAAETAQFHIENDDNGVMRMRRVSAIDIKSGARFSFKPGGTHVMLVGVKEPLREGETLPLTLDFNKAGKLQVDIPIGKPGAMSPPRHEQHGEVTFSFHSDRRNRTMMRTMSKLAITIALGLGVAACARGAAAPSNASTDPGMMFHGAMMGDHGSMMGNGAQDEAGDHGMPGMMQQMSSMMDDCNKMMESHMQQPDPQSPQTPLPDHKG
jgi:hypothetical protein